MKLHIDYLEEKLSDLDYCKEENLNLKENLKEYNQLKNENISLISSLKQSEENLQKMIIKINELEEKSKYVKCVNVTLPVSVMDIYNEIFYRKRILLKNLKVLNCLLNGKFRHFLIFLLGIWV